MDHEPSAFQSTTPPSQPDAGMSADAAMIIAPLVQSSGWMKFFAILTILAGIGMTLSTYCVGIVIAWLPIWAGILFWQASTLYSVGHMARDVHAAAFGSAKLRLGFKLMGIYAICLISLIVLFLFLVLGLGLFAGLMSSQGGPAGP